MKKFFSRKRGNSLIEIVIVIGIFALISASFALVLIHSFSGILRAEQYLKAESILNEAENGIIAIKKRAFNEFIYNKSSVGFSSGKWELLGEGRDYSENGFLRNIYFSNVFRNNSGLILMKETWVLLMIL